MRKILTWLARLLGPFERFDIGRPNQSVYLTRWTLWGQRYGKPGAWRVFLHCFHRGDAEPYFHDHPWPFVSLILSGGYWEHTPRGKRWYGPGRLLRRPAEWAHRVELPAGKRCWTVVITGPKSRSWGFHCAAGWLGWREHVANIDAGKPGCGVE